MLADKIRKLTDKGYEIVFSQGMSENEILITMRRNNNCVRRATSLSELDKAKAESDYVLSYILEFLEAYWQGDFGGSVQ